jgi:hypothetical protein
MERDEELQWERFAPAWPARLRTHPLEVLAFLVVMFTRMVTLMLEMPRNDLLPFLVLLVLTTRFPGGTTAQRFR